jgi:hypothetical protein
MTSRDRRAAILASLEYNGIDFVDVANQAQTELRVHFLNAVNVEGSLIGVPAITGGETIPTVVVLPIGSGDWGWDDGHIVLTLRVAAPGDFSNYTLSIPSPVLDPFFSHVSFSFKAGCPSDLDCETPAAPCPPPSGNAPPIDYLAKDFLSFRQALLDFSLLRYSSWQERSEADFGMMFLESLSAIADDLSYTQDRVASEGSLLTATQRRSVLRHARLVDYEPTPAIGATAQLQFEVTSSTNVIPHAIAAIAPAPDGTPITFETGLGLRDPSHAPPANALWNRGATVPISAYWFDDGERCLQAGATSMYVLGHGYGFQAGQMLLIETLADDAADPPIRQIVRLLQAGDAAGPWMSELCDPLFPLPIANGGPPFLTCPISPPATVAPAAVTRITWEAADTLLVSRDLAQTTVIGNIANATQGRTVTSEPFVIGQPPGDAITPIPTAIERTGPRPLESTGLCGSPAVIRMYTLAHAPLTWLRQSAIDPSLPPVPEILLTQAPTTLGSASVTWSWSRSLLSAAQFDNGFTIDPVSYRTVARNSDGTIQSDYDGDGGDTLRFGDGVFGANPQTGMRFTATYRFGAGSAGNVAAGAICQLDPAVLAGGEFQAVMNPLGAFGGADPQTLQSIQRLAPQAFSAPPPRRAVIAADYVAAADAMPWVKRAGTVFRWTGSWLTTFTTPEPVATEQIPIDDRISLVSLLNRYRMAGTESYVPDPDYVSIDLVIDLCALPSAFVADVKQTVTAALSPTGPGAATAYFAVSRFAFGQSLERSTLEAAIQAVPGVAGVTCIRYRLRDRSPVFGDMGDIVAVGANQIIRCDNDPSRPNNGALTIVVGGGR